MQIRVLEKSPPLRVMSGFGAHTVGGVGTPHQLKKSMKPMEWYVSPTAATCTVRSARTINSIHCSRPSDGVI
jgi:hypothetical protein